MFALSAHLRCIVVICALLPCAGRAGTIYNTIANPLPPNVSSLGNEAYSTKELGNLVSFEPGPRTLTSVTVIMSNWAYASEHPGVGTPDGYLLPLTVNLYDVGANDTVGSLFATRTIDALIPWRPEPTASCSGGPPFYPWLASNGKCYNGYAFAVTLDFSGVAVPDQLIYGITYNTQHYGYTPTGVAGPYDSLNIGLTTASPSVGSNPAPGTLYWNTTDNGVTGTFRQTSFPYVPTVEFDVLTAIPEPSTSSTVTLALIGVVLIGLGRRRKA